ncbi:MAG: hypothetical protein UR83_C0011G0011 [Candidatus Moranbacteria bacterium GW2011_GWF2_35_54]|nr:MAG: hypothetical protein UR83_C0011G0011 [Candidatus Moranbacteria bacterium GW2011_GWF2_35_54]
MNNKEIKNENHSGFTKVKMSVVFLCLVVAMVYLGIINASAVKGYEIKKVEQKIEEIQEAELNSFYNIKDNIGNLNMVEVKDVVYIDDNEGAVALKK